MYFINMGLFGSFVIGFSFGIVSMYMFVKFIINKNRQKFIDSINKLIEEKMLKPNKTKMILDAINNDLDQLVKYNGQEVDVENEYYLSCMIDGKMVMLPEKCLRPICEKEKC